MWHCCRLFFHPPLCFVCVKIPVSVNSVVSLVKKRFACAQIDVYLPEDFSYTIPTAVHRCKACFSALRHKEKLLTEAGVVAYPNADGAPRDEREMEEKNCGEKEKVLNSR